MNLRLIAAKIIAQVTQGASLSDRLELSTSKNQRDRAFVQAICYGVCRFYPRLDVILSHLLNKPMKAKNADVHALLCVGLYQLMEMRVPAHAALAETVNATIELKKPWAKGLVNALLRQYLRDKDKIASLIATDLVAYYAHPTWWLTAIKAAWPTQWQAILTANNMHPPLALRVNLQRQTRAQYLTELGQINCTAELIPETKSGIVLQHPMPIEDLPGFAQGKVSVQDGAAQLAAEILMLAPKQRLLDVCAAPGGKLTHILEYEPQLAEVIAIDSSSERMAAIKENLARLKFAATLICHDANDSKQWWDGELFDRILLDAPCSASGVIRRHPDIKLLRQAQDIKILAKQQLQLLTSLWPLLKPGGILVYATCSIFPEENQQVIQQFFSTQTDAKEDKINASWGLACDIGRQILPGMHNMDGFYYARLTKCTP